MTKFDFAMETTSKTIKDSLAVAAKRHFKVFKIGENYAIDFATKGYKIPEHGIYPEIAKYESKPLRMRRRIG